MINCEIEANIIRKHLVENWPIGTIESQLGIHHSVVRRVLNRTGHILRGPKRKSKVDSFLPFIAATTGASAIRDGRGERGLQWPISVPNTRSRQAERHDRHAGRWSTGGLRSPGGVDITSPPATCTPACTAWSTPTLTSSPPIIGMRA